MNVTKKVCRLLEIDAEWISHLELVETPDASYVIVESDVEIMACSYLYMIHSCVKVLNKWICVFIVRDQESQEHIISELADEFKKNVTIKVHN